MDCSSACLCVQVFSGLPILLLGVFDQDLSAKTAMLFPYLYTDGILQKRLNLKVFMYVWAVEGCMLRLSLCVALCVDGPQRLDRVVVLGVARHVLCAVLCDDLR